MTPVQCTSSYTSLSVCEVVYQTSQNFLSYASHKKTKTTDKVIPRCLPC